jgi:hypothetical protein
MRTVELAVAILGCIGMIACVPVVAAKSKAERVGFFVSPMGEPFRISPESDQRPFVTWFASADRNKDGKLDGMEFRADAERFFRSLDVDHDGRIGATEMRRYEEEIVPEIHTPTLGRSQPTIASLMNGAGGAGGRRMGRPDPEQLKKKLRELEAKRPQGLELFGLLSIPHPVASADRNLNFVISDSEFSSAADERFASLDRDGDGLFTPTDARLVLHERQRRR